MRSKILITILVLLIDLSIVYGLTQSLACLHFQARYILSINGTYCARTVGGTDFAAPLLKLQERERLMNDPSY